MSEEQLKELASYSAILASQIQCDECPIKTFCRDNSDKYHSCSETILNFLANADERLDIDDISPDRFACELTVSIRKEVFGNG